MKKVKITKKFLLLISIILMIVVITTSVIYQKKNNSITITAVVTNKANDYILVNDTNNNKYKLNAVENIAENDVLSITINNINDRVSPITADIKKINIISKSVTFTIIDNTNLTTNDTKIDSIDENQDVSNNLTSDEYNVIAYIENLNNEVDDNSTFSAVLKEKIITVIDFLFYDGSISGIKFSDLSQTAKLKVLSLVLKIDSKVEQKFPNYKEELSSNGSRVYTNLKNKILERYFSLATQLCSNNDVLCSTAKEELKKIKDSLFLTWDDIKKLFKNNKEQLQTWYEIWREA